MLTRNLRETAAFPAGHNLTLGGIFMAKLFTLDLKITGENLTVH